MIPFETTAYRIPIQDPQEGEIVRRPTGEIGTSQEQGGQGGQPLGPDAPRGSAQDACLQQLPFLLAMVAIFYFLLIRPQQKQEKKRREMLSALRAGDRVVTSGGLHGVVAKLSETTAEVDLAQNVRITVDRANIARVHSDEAGEAGGK